MLETLTSIWKTFGPANDPLACALFFMCVYLGWLRHNDTVTAREERKDRLETSKMNIVADEKIATALTGLIGAIGKIEGMISMGHTGRSR